MNILLGILGGYLIWCGAIVNLFGAFLLVEVWCVKRSVAKRRAALDKWEQDRVRWRASYAAADAVLKEVDALVSSGGTVET